MPRRHVLVVFVNPVIGERSDRIKAIEQLMSPDWSLECHVVSAGYEVTRARAYSAFNHLMPPDCGHQDVAPPISPSRFHALMPGIQDVTHISDELETQTTIQLSSFGPLLAWRPLRLLTQILQASKTVPRCGAMLSAMPTGLSGAHSRASISSCWIPSPQAWLVAACGSSKWRAGSDE